MGIRELMTVPRAGDVSRRTMLLAAAAAASTYWLAARLMAWRRLHNARQRGAGKRERCRRQIQEYARRLRSDRSVVESKDSVTSLSLQQLVDALKSGELKAVHVLRCFQLKAIEAHEKTNCLIEFIDEAESIAQAFDDSPDKSGLMAGVPISCKEDICIKGYDSTAGCYKFVGTPAEDEPAFLKVLRQQGAIPFVRTNIPQLMLSAEGGNPIFGAAVNPHDPSRGSGGSSSGEAPLVALGGSIVGLGSDGGGSIRIPACYNGICGIKPTFERISVKGNPYYTMDYTCIHPVWGPLARDVDTLSAVLRAFWSGNMHQQDVTIPPMNFNNELYESSRPLTIGFYTKLEGEGYVTAVPAMERAVHMAKAVLEKRGHKVVAWQPPPGACENVEWQWETMVGVDAGQECRDVMVDEDIHDSIVGPITAAMTPNWLKPILGYLLRKSDPVRATIMRVTRGHLTTTEKYFQHARKVKEFIYETSESWKAQGLDAVICPGYAYPPLPIGKGNADLYWAAINYTAFYNCTNFPAGMVPATRVTQGDLDAMADYPDHTDYYRRVHQCMKGTVGLPVGVQVAALTFYDEICLRVMREIQEGLASSA